MWTKIYSELSFQGYVKPKINDGSGDSIVFDG